MRSERGTPHHSDGADDTEHEADRPHRVVVLVRDDNLPIELGIVHQLFGSARATGDGRRLYEVVTCALRPGELRTDGDFGLLVRNGPEALATADTAVVLSSHEDYDRSGTALPRELAAAFARIPPGARVASICTGAFVLAAAGLLDGHRATTHWRYTDRFRRLFPRVVLDPDVLFTHSVDAGREVLTSAGCAAGIDLCLHLLREDHGAAVTNEVARAAVVPPYREGGQAQFVRRPVPETHARGTAAARAWALEHLAEPITVGRLAACESLSVRAFSRRFRDETGMPPLRWLIGQRVARARQLLEETDLPVEAVAARAGFGTAVALRQQLHAAVGVSPTAYRATFRGPNGGAGDGAGGGAEGGPNGREAAEGCREDGGAGTAPEEGEPAPV
ncbi:GlxA family transcriptional regulator [Streptomyces spiramenti]|uniref:Helix-turn-helix domain-containing protein n=1 Tax=Streptomyces spiramenti TaxID=2720606 RepID=A0ABX1ANJ7_9ACTN|nr:helix-turn-helix domain-containing protein [Streptomyces spiramenti]NJP67681.1 helix-turn-helix domain-containing protein [Streptomyces spiramenti]